MEDILQYYTTQTVLICAMSSSGSGSLCLCSALNLVLCTVFLVFFLVFFRAVSTLFLVFFRAVSTLFLVLFCLLVSICLTNSVCFSRTTIWIQLSTILKTICIITTEITRELRLSLNKGQLLATQTTLYQFTVCSNSHVLVRVILFMYNAHDCFLPLIQKPPLRLGTITAEPNDSLFPIWYLSMVKSSYQAIVKTSRSLPGLANSNQCVTDTNPPICLNAYKLDPS